MVQINFFGPSLHYCCIPTYSLAIIFFLAHTQGYTTAVAPSRHSPSPAEKGVRSRREDPWVATKADLIKQLSIRCQYKAHQLKVTPANIQCSQQTRKKAIVRRRKNGSPGKHTLSPAIFPVTLMMVLMGWDTLALAGSSCPGCLHTASGLQATSQQQQDTWNLPLCSCEPLLCTLGI